MSEYERDRRQRNRELQVLMIKQRLLGLLAIVLAVVILMVVIRYPCFEHPDDVSGILFLVILGLLLLASGDCWLDRD